MSVDVGVAELRRHLARYLHRAAAGERVVVTERGRPIAQLGPVSVLSLALDQLSVEAPAQRDHLPSPLPPDPGDRNGLSRALRELRDAESR